MIVAFQQHLPKVQSYGLLNFEITERTRVSFDPDSVGMAIPAYSRQGFENQNRRFLLILRWNGYIEPILRIDPE